MRYFNTGEPETIIKIIAEIGRGFRRTFIDLAARTAGKFEALFTSKIISGAVIRFDTQGPSPRDIMPLLLAIRKRHKYLVLCCTPDTEDLAAVLENLFYERLFLCFQGTTPKEAFFRSRYFTERDFLFRHKIAEALP